MQAKFEVWHLDTYQSDAFNMTDALDCCGLWANMGYVNLVIKRKADGKTWKYN